MNLEQLTKHQIVLLTLLVSFVTSIATGIVTVSLMDQAPPEVTRVVNQIVEHTVEKVIPSTQGAAVVTSEKTVVIKDDDLATQSIAKVQKSMIRVTVKGGELLISRGLVIDANGVAIADKTALAAADAKEFEAILPSGERVQATLRAGGATTSAIAILDLTLSTTTTLTPAALANPAKLALGQSVIRIGGKGADSVGNGVIATLPSKDNLDLIEASVSSATAGSVLMTLFGEVIGLTTGASAKQGGEFYSLIAAPDTQPDTSGATNQ
ncbi:MAG TPA: trypsin-like peptidase domain-containing protein [Candidatus Paceibacterota bacterium]|nr:trypsin-like peptidase domain-containing protein [Candidatus Paceibacterota bacterium]